MSARDTGETPVPPPGPPAGPAPARPSWDAVPRPAAPPRTAARSMPPEAPRPYYAAPPPVPAAPPPPAAPPAAPTFQEEVKYDLAGNPIAPRASVPAPASMPQAQAGYPTGAATAWPPPVGGPAYGIGPRNTSGEGGDVPPEVARLSWNWGAFFFPVMWCRKHGLAAEANILRYSFLAIVVLRLATHGSIPIAFLILGIIYGVAYSGARIYFAVKGHQMGWRSRHFPGGVQEYFQVQKAWMWWGFGISAAWAFVLPVLLFLGLLGAGLAAQHGSGYGGYNRPSNSWPTSGGGMPGNGSSAPPASGGN